MKATSFLAQIAVLLPLIAANSASAQLRVEDQLKIGDIRIKYDSNRWMLTSGRTTTKARLVCRGLDCGLDVGIEVDEKINVCRAEIVEELLLQRLRQATTERFSLYRPELRKVQQFGKMTLHMARAHNGCHVPTDFVFACGEYRGKTYSVWLTPNGCVISGATGYSDQLMTRLLSGIVAP